MTKPFDLEKALQGEPVVLRDGSKAFLLKMLDNAKYEESVLSGYFIDKSDQQDFAIWSKSGEWLVNKVHPLDIVGMWEDPQKMFKTADGVELPLPLSRKKLSRNGGKYYFVGITGKAFGAVFNGVNIDHRLEDFGNCFATEEDAKAWSDYFRSLLRQARDMNDENS